MSVLSQGFKLYGPLSNNNGAPAGGDGKSDQTDWKEKYEGLQAQIAAGQYVTKDAYVTLQRNLETAVNERKAAQADLGNAQAKIVLLGESESGLKKTIADLQQGEQSLKDELNKNSALLQRHQVIFKEFPELAPFEADGLLPAPQGDQKLEEVLGAFSQRIRSIGENAAKTFQKTASPQQPTKAPGDNEKTSSELLREANALLGSGKVADYNAKMDAYHAAKAKETT